MIETDNELLNLNVINRKIDYSDEEPITLPTLNIVTDVHNFDMNGGWKFAKESIHKYKALRTPYVVSLKKRIRNLMGLNNVHKINSKTRMYLIKNGYRFLYLGTPGKQFPQQIEDIDSDVTEDELHDLNDKGDTNIDYEKENETLDDNIKLVQNHGTGKNYAESVTGSVKSGKQGSLKAMSMKSGSVRAASLKSVSIQSLSVKNTPKKSGSVRSSSIRSGSRRSNKSAYEQYEDNVIIKLNENGIICVYPETNDTYVLREIQYGTMDDDLTEEDFIERVEQLYNCLRDSPYFKGELIEPISNHSYHVQLCDKYPLKNFSDVTDCLDFIKKILHGITDDCYSKEENIKESCFWNTKKFEKGYAHLSKNNKTWIKLNTNEKMAIHSTSGDIYKLIPAPLKLKSKKDVKNKPVEKLTGFFGETYELKNMYAIDPSNNKTYFCLGLKWKTPNREKDLPVDKYKKLCKMNLPPADYSKFKKLLDGAQDAYCDYNYSLSREVTMDDEFYLSNACSIVLDKVNEKMYVGQMIESKYALDVYTQAQIEQMKNSREKSKIAILANQEKKSMQKETKTTNINEKIPAKEETEIKPPETQDTLVTEPESNSAEEPAEAENVEKNEEVTEKEE